ncbi:SigE family RNA polymerase sigma factor [Solicola gregarius]|uniref:SigE family RNA polymerase sigma factor n=1 Tax=Solicola gregarius TaxID=2908642 RepID=A0AA46THD4_9ACTN|nr:SigE family RNA polymerase sigma factor [Solicola gregarius]UYM04538.1 SigE family RNA polymerase sigma factor [Solicola gregarius]
MTIATPLPATYTDARLRSGMEALWHAGRTDQNVGANVSDVDATFDAFVRARLPDLLRFGRMLTGSDEAAADLVQDALERTIMHWSRVESRDDPEGYVRRVMVNRNISIWRRLRRERITDTLPDDGYVDRHRDRELWEALLTLPPRQRAVIALRYYEDKTEADVAAILGCSVGTVKSQASKAITKLRALVPTFADASGRRRGGDDV